MNGKFLLAACFNESTNGARKTPQRSRLACQKQSGMSLYQCMYNMTVPPSL
jgi:hypothetical protein